MAVDHGEIRWYSPDPRGVIPLQSFHVPSRLARVIRSGKFSVDVDREFEAVMRACAESDRNDDDPGTWISDEILESYVELHRLGVAHSVEAWQEDRLVGGLYGVALGGAFFLLASKLGLATWPTTADPAAAPLPLGATGGRSGWPCQAGCRPPGNCPPR